MSVPRPPRQASEELPVAHVAVDVSLAHLDRPFDYAVARELHEAVVPGCRVRVRFAGRLVDGFVLGRAEHSEHQGTLAFLEKVVSPEPVLRPDIAELARTIADRYAGTFADVVRLAVPPRHGRVEAAPTPVANLSETGPRWMPPSEAWGDYPTGPAFLTALGQGRPARAVFTVLPGEDWAARIAEAVAATAHAGRGAVVVVPDSHDLDRLDAALAASMGASAYVALHAALGPAERYRRFLRASRGQVRVVAGTRAAAFAPVEKLGLVVIWDDGDDLHAEPRAPYPHALQVLLSRAQLADVAALVVGTSRSAEAQLLIETRWAKEIVASREVVRRRAPAVVPTGDDTDRERDPAAVSARLPSVAWRTARDSLAQGAPVLVQVPRRGYVPSVSCVECHTPARCGRCAGPLELGSARAVAACRWCGRPAADFACQRCGGRRLRASVVGMRRTAEELGRAFPGVPVRTSGRDEVLALVAAQPAVVVATPGAEPAAEGGYGAVLLLDTWALLTRADLRAGEEALRRWFAAATLARPADQGGRVVIVADGGLVPVQALLRWDPATFAARELGERRELGFPPAARMASLTGPADAVADLLTLLALPEGADVLGPVAVGPVAVGPAAVGSAAVSSGAVSSGAAGSGAVGSAAVGRAMAGAAVGGAAAGDQERALVRVASRASGGALALALQAAAGVRSARKADGNVRIHIDPRDLW